MLARVNPTALVVAGLVCFVTVVAALLGLYALAPAKPPVGPLFAAIPGALAAAGTLAVGLIQRRHSEQLTTIGKNTNGVLTSRINDAIASAVPIAVATALAGKAVVNVAPVPAQPPAPAVEQLVPAETTGA